MSPSNFTRKLLATLTAIAVGLGGLLFVQPATAEDGDPQALDFAACVAAQGTGSVLVLMDESDTVYGTNGRPPSDPSNLRVAGAQLLIDDIQRVVDASSTPVNVQLAGFGDNYVTRSSGWTAIRPGDQGVSANRLKTEVAVFASRPTDGNQIETDLWTAIDGARTEFNSQVQCKLLVFFKDGLDFQKFDAANSSPHKLADVQELLEEASASTSVTKARQAAALAAADLCRPKGLADGLRGDGIFLISVGLGEGDFSELQALTENTNRDCGELPGRGYLLRAENPRDLINLFARTLNPSNLAAEFDGSFTFEMSPALSTISIVTSGMTAGGQYFITPPPACPAAVRTSFNSAAAQSSGSFGTGVQWNGAGYAEGEVLRIFINRTSNSNLDCWSGVWTVDPGTQARSALSLEADLQPVAVFTSENPSVQPGQTISFQPLLRKISAPGESGTRGLPGLTGEDLHPDLRVSLTGSVFNPQGVEILQLFSGAALSAADLGRAEDIFIPEELPLGNYLVRLTLSLDVVGIDISLNDVRSETVVEVRGPIPLPTVEGIAQFPEILGSSPSSTKVLITNSADKPVSLVFSSATVSTTQAPEGATDYKVAGSAERLEIAAGESVEVELFLSPDTSEQVQFAGQISGSLFIPVEADGERLPANFQLEVPFKAEQLPDQNLVLLILFTLLFLFLGTVLTVGAIWLVSYRVSRFPKARKIQENVLQSVTLDAVLDASGLQLLQPLPAFESDQWQPIQVMNRRAVMAGFHQLRAKSPGLRLGQIGHAQVADPTLLGWGMSGSGAEVDRKNFKPRSGLDLQQNFFVTVRPEDLMNSDSQIRAQVTFISSLNSFESNEDLVESARASAFDVFDDFTKFANSRFSRTQPDFFGQTNQPTFPGGTQPGSDPFA